MKKSGTKTIAYLALYVALYVVLKYVGNLIPFLRMPNGGSIELELIAVFLCSYHLGWKLGIADAVLSWLITIVVGFEMWFVQPVQILLDYVLPLVVCGMASLLWPMRDLKKPGAAVFGLLLGTGTFLGVYNSWSKTTGALLAGLAIGAAMFVFVLWYVSRWNQFGIVIGVLLKYFFQVLSGVYFWFPEGSAAGSSEAWIFSLSYNLWYNLVTMAVCLFVVPMLINRLKKGGVNFSA